MMTGCALEGRGDLAVGLELLLLAGKLGGVHEQELRAEQSDGLGIMLERVGHVVRAADVAGDDLLDAVGRPRILAAERLEGRLLGSELLGGGGVLGEGRLVGLGKNDALEPSTTAVMPLRSAEQLLATDRTAGISSARAMMAEWEVRPPVSVTMPATLALSMVAVIDGVRSCTTTMVFSGNGQVNDLDAEELGEDAGADVGDIGRTQTEHLVIHGQEHVRTWSRCPAEPARRRCRRRSRP